jgi:hypothetical protein
VNKALARIIGRKMELKGCLDYVKFITDDLIAKQTNITNIYRGNSNLRCFQK